MSKQSDLVSVSQGASGDPLYIDTANDRVGIGTSSPARALHVQTNQQVVSRFNAGTNSKAILSLEDTNTTGENYVSIASEGNDMFFRAGGQDRMRIDSSGRVLVGKTIPNATTNGVFLSADSGTNFVFPSNHYVIFNRNASGAATLLDFRVENVSKGSITFNGTNISYNTSSDYRLKENVTPLDNAADRLAQIPVHRFNFIADPDTTVDGFLAHEVQAFVPEAITVEHDGVDADGNPVYQGIDQSKLVPLLTAALQEALQKIDALEARVATLEGGAA